MRLHAPLGHIIFFILPYFFIIIILCSHLFIIIFYSHLFLLLLFCILTLYFSLILISSPILVQKWLCGSNVFWQRRFLMSHVRTVSTHTNNTHRCHKATALAKEVTSNMIALAMKFNTHYPPILVQKCECASKVFWQRRFLMSHVRTVLSSAALSRNRPPGCTARPRTQLSWPISVNRHRPTPASHTCELNLKN